MPRELGHWPVGSQEGVLAEPVSVNSLGRRRRTGRSVHAEEATEQRQWVGDVWAVSQGTPTQGLGLYVLSGHSPRDPHFRPWGLARLYLPSLCAFRRPGDSNQIVCLAGARCHTETVSH